jgi:hypothetical protein
VIDARRSLPCLTSLAFAGLHAHAFTRAQFERYTMEATPASPSNHEQLTEFDMSATPLSDAVGAVLPRFTSLMRLHLSRLDRDAHTFAFLSSFAHLQGFDFERNSRDTMVSEALLMDALCTVVSLRSLTLQYVSLTVAQLTAVLRRHSSLSMLRLHSMIQVRSLSWLDELDADSLTDCSLRLGHTATAEVARFDRFHALRTLDVERSFYPVLSESIRDEYSTSSATFRRDRFPTMITSSVE